MKIKCPACGRNQEITPTSDGKFQMPWHENYRKTEVCNASEKHYGVAAPSRTTSDPFLFGGHLGGLNHVAALVALACAGSSKRHRGRIGPGTRHRGNR